MSVAAQSVRLSDDSDRDWVKGPEESSRGFAPVPNRLTVRSGTRGPIRIVQCRATPVIQLSDLPAPPPGKSGWPWTEAPVALAARRPDGGAWPTISIVTPSFNQGDYVEETIRSVLLQGYPSIEYVVVDGGSTDKSAEIIRRYAPWLTYWQSQRDGGQADAVNIGLGLCTGEIFNFINSDDTLLPGALQRIGMMDAAVLGIAGSVINRGPAGDQIFFHGAMTLADLLRYDHFHQPGIWLRRASVMESGGFDAAYRYCFDKKFYLRFLAHHDGRIASICDPLVVFRVHDASKTMTSHASFRAETLRAMTEVLPEISGPSEQALALGVMRRLRREEARDALLVSAAKILAGPRPSLSARLSVAMKLPGGDAAGARVRLVEMIAFGSDEARRRSLARKARRAESGQGK